MYEVWSSDNLNQLDNIGELLSLAHCWLANLIRHAVWLMRAVAEDHAQQDEVWQPKPRQSREWLKTAISKFRGIFTDIR